jgi:hypothetical protein
VEQLSKKCCISDALDDAEYCILRDTSDIGCSDFRSYLEESLDSECKTGCTGEEDSA